MCKTFLMTQRCDQEDCFYCFYVLKAVEDCQFAHSLDELRATDKLLGESDIISAFSIVLFMLAMVLT